MSCKSLGAICLLAFLMATEAWAQAGTNFFTTSPPNPVGSGARAMGMGGAFIAVGDDGTAASWNPACLIQLEKPEASFVVTQDFRDIDGANVDFFGGNYISMSYPFTVKSSSLDLFGQSDINMILSFNYQKLFDMFSDFGPKTIDDREFQSGFDVAVEGGDSTITTDDFFLVWTNQVGKISDLSSEQSGDLGALAPAFAIQLGPKLSVGMTYNFWRDGWLGSRVDQEYEESGTSGSKMTTDFWTDTVAPYCACNGGHCLQDMSVDDPSCLDALFLSVPNAAAFTTESYDNRTKFRMEGRNFNVGVLYDVNGRWTVGGVYRSPVKMEVERTVDTTFRKIDWEDDGLGNVTINGDNITKWHNEYEDKVTFPESYGLGVGYRFSDALSFTADVTRVNWNEYVYEQEGGTRYSLVNGLKPDKADVAPTYTVRAGGEYLIIKPKYVVPIRAGFFYDPEPAKDQPDDVYGITAGSGFAFKWMAFDLTYFYRFGNDIILNVTADPAHEQIVEVKRGDLAQHMLMLSTIVYFE